MVNQKILKYLKEGLSKNNSLKELKQSLVKVGWSQQIVNEAVSSLNKKTKPSPKPKTPTVPVKKQELNYFEKVKLLFLHPTQFFNSVGRENKYWLILKFFVIFYVFVVILNLILNIVTKGGSFSLGLILRSIFEIGMAFVSPFVGAAIIHLGVLIFGGRQSYFNTFKPVTYASMVGLVYYLSMIIVNAILSLVIKPSSTSSIDVSLMGTLLPYIIVNTILVIIMVIHVLVVEIMGVSKFQNISKWRAFFGIIIIPFVLFIIGIVLFILVFSRGIGAGFYGLA